MRRIWPLAVVLFMAGCLQEEAAKTTLVPADPFGRPTTVKVPTKASYSAASQEAATRVVTVGQKILEANKQLGLQQVKQRPVLVFSTIGSPQAEIFHRGGGEILITEGLVKQCTTEGQLAAVLSQELGKLIAERQLQSSAELKRRPEPPREWRDGNSGAVGAPDQLHLYEMAKYDEERRRVANQSANPPDPQALARTFLTRAGYPATDLDAVGPLLKAADANCALEKQLTTGNAAAPTTR